MKELVKKLRCWVGLHQWVNLRKDMPIIPKNGGISHYTARHKCDKCGKEELLGMGGMI